MHRVWNLRTLHRCKKEEYKKKSSITKENQKNFKNIGSKTPFLKDFASTKKFQEQYKEIMQFKYEWPPCYMVNYFKKVKDIANV